MHEWTGILEPLVGFPSIYAKSLVSFDGKDQTARPFALTNQVNPTKSQVMLGEGR